MRFKNKPIPSEKSGNLIVSITIPEQLVPTQSRGTLDGISVSEVEFTVTKGTRTYTNIETVSGSIVESVFPALEPGNWQISVIAREVNGSTKYDVFKGQGTGTVEADKITTVPVEMKLVDGNLSLTVNIPEGFRDAERVRVSLSSAGSSPIVREYLIADLTEPVTFGDLKSTAWKVEVEVLDALNAICATVSGVIDVKPGRTVAASVSFDLGQLEIQPVWHMPPEKPVNLQAIPTETAVRLTWEAPAGDVAGYSIARSSSADGKKVILNDSLILGLEYTDSDVTGGKKYYYWVAAYDYEGFYSGWVGPVEGQLLGDFFGLEIGRKWNVTTCELRLDGSYYGGCEEFTIELMSSQNLGDVLAFEFIVDQFGEYQTTLKALKRDNAYFFVDPEDNEQFVLQLPVQPGDLVMPLTVPLHGFEPLYLVGEDEVELDGIVKTALFAQKEWIVDEYGYEAEAELWLVPYTGEWKAVVKFYAPEEDFGWQMVLECVLLDE